MNKTCVLCGVDCAGSPRIRDREGRYFHEACYDRAIRHRDRRREAVVAAGGPAQPSMRCADDDPFKGVFEEISRQTLPTTRCPACHARNDTGLTRCPSCGHDVAV